MKIPLVAGQQKKVLDVRAIQENLLARGKELFGENFTLPSFDFDMNDNHEDLDAQTFIRLSTDGPPDESIEFFEGYSPPDTRLSRIDIPDFSEILSQRFEAGIMQKPQEEED